MENTLQKWLTDGGSAPFKFEEEGKCITVIRVPFNDTFDYLFCQRHYRTCRIERGDSFRYAGIYHKPEGVLYDPQYELAFLDPEAYERRTAKRFLVKLQDDVRREISALVGNDRTRLKITALSEDKDIEYIRKYTAPRVARERFLSTEDGAELEPFEYEPPFTPSLWTEETLLEYIAAPDKYTRALAVQFFETEQESILISFLAGDAIAAEYALLSADTGNAAHLIKKIRRAVIAADAKTVTVTLCREGEEITFKCEARPLTQDCGDYYSGWSIAAADRKAIDARFGRYKSDFRPHEIVKITYGRNAIYET
jgi:hypothetical protein